jgi:hypothetical protein
MQIICHAAGVATIIPDTAALPGASPAFQPSWSPRGTATGEAAVVVAKAAFALWPFISTFTSPKPLLSRAICHLRDILRLALPKCRASHGLVHRGNRGFSSSACNYINGLGRHLLIILFAV